jgi:hypothetical protein
MRICAHPEMSSFSMEQSSTNNKRSKITELFQGWVRSNGNIQNIKSIYIHFYLQKKKRFNKNEQYSNIIKKTLQEIFVNPSLGNPLDLTSVTLFREQDTFKYIYLYFSLIFVILTSDIRHFF